MRITTAHGVQEHTHVTLGGIEQYVQIRGEDRLTPSSCGCMAGNAPCPITRRGVELARSVRPRRSARAGFTLGSSEYEDGECVRKWRHGTDHRYHRRARA